MFFAMKFAGVSRPEFVDATGGVISVFTNPLNGYSYKIHAFTTNSNFVVNSPGELGTVDVLMVGGGGGSGGVASGAAAASGGGGAGQLTSATSIAITASSFSIVVGQGGAGGANTGLQGGTGTNSTVLGLTAYGGGGGGGSANIVGGNSVSSLAGGGAGAGTASSGAGGALGGASGFGSATATQRHGGSGGNGFGSANGQAGSSSLGGSTTGGYTDAGGWYGDNIFNAVSLLLDGENLLDKGQSGVTVSQGGAATTSTTNPKYGLASFYSPGTSVSSAISIPSNAAFAFGTANWCIDMWVSPLTNPTAAAGANQYNIFNWSNVAWIRGTQPGNSDYVAGKPYIAAFNVTGNPGVNFTMSTGTYHHVALTKVGTSASVYVDGVLAGTTSSAALGTLNITAQTMQLFDEGGTGKPFAGYIDMFRMTKGSPRYTANFTPPDQGSYFPMMIAGGGAGGAEATGPGVGLNGGGAGGANAVGTRAVPYSGGGGGGSGSTAAATVGANGGQGAVYIRYRIS